MAKFIQPPAIEPIMDKMEEVADKPHTEVEMTRTELKKLTKVKDEMAVVIGDTHFPYEDKEAMELFFAWLEDNRDRVSRLFLNGDIIDHFSLSKFAKNPKQPDAGITVEINKAKEFFEKVRDIIDCPVYYISGNHELRLSSYLKTKAPELWDVVKLPDLLDLDKFNIKWIPGKKDAFVQYGNTLIGHFNKVSKHSAYTAKGLAEDFPGFNIVQNHTHRRGMYWKNDIWAAENSCMADATKADYVGGIPNWQSGFLTIKTDSEGKQIPEFVNIQDDKLKYRDDIYE